MLLVFSLTSPIHLLETSCFGRRTWLTRHVLQASMIYFLPISWTDLLMSNVTKRPAFIYSLSFEQPVFLEIICLSLFLSNVARYHKAGMEH